MVELTLNAPTSACDHELPHEWLNIRSLSIKKLLINKNDMIRVLFIIITIVYIDPFIYIMFFCRVMFSLGSPRAF